MGNRWFGSPWPSGWCYDENEQIRWDAHVETPVGVICFDCMEPIEDGDQGILMPMLLADDEVSAMPQHKECGLRAVVGGIRHLRGECRYIGDCAQNPPEGMSRREEALAVWDHVQRFGVTGH